MKLYELTEAYADLMLQLEEADNPVAQEKILQALANVGDAIADKGENYARIIKNEESDISMLDKEIKRLQAMKQAKENTVRRMKGNMYFAMEIAGATSIQTSIGKWRIQQNPPKVEVLDISRVPARFLVEQEPKVNKQAVLEEFRLSGELFDGLQIVRESGVRFG